MAPPAPAADEDAFRHQGALRLLSLLQQKGRLVDFLEEPIGEFDDAQIGAAVRPIHKGCREVLAQYLPLKPVLEGEEESPVTVESGFDPSAIRLVGKVQGEPPFKGTLLHHGWRVAEVKLAYPSEAVDARVVAPAEVEL